METYSVLTDFGGVNPNIYLLHIEINNLISVDVEGINLEGGNVNIYFTSSISPAEKLILDKIVSKHGIKYFPLPLKLMQVNNTSYERITLVDFPEVKHVKVRGISYMDPSCSSYDITFVDKNTSITLLTANLNNTIELSQVYGVFSSLPSDFFELEVSVKRNGGNVSANIDIESIVLEIK